MKSINRVLSSLKENTLVMHNPQKYNDSVRACVCVCEILKTEID